MLKLRHAILYLLYRHLSETMAFPSILSNIIGVSAVSSEWLKPTLPMKRETASNGSTTLWVIQDTYEGSTFFDTFDFYTGPDPTNGLVTFVDRQTAFSSGLANVTTDNKVIMQGDNTTQLSYGVNRSSVRISSQTQYNMGLFILDLEKTPWGCGVWPAFWTVGSGTWPWNGEIDIIEGVQDNEYNQITWHTAPGCNLTQNTNFSGIIVQTNGSDNLQCNALIDNNAGCGVTEWSRASYGPLFDAQNGGVFAMNWDENGITVWSFYRSLIPPDITQGEPDPYSWGEPDAVLSAQSCNITQYFANHSIIFDITFCGDWAGNSYATSGCPGTCENRLMDPTNFDNATWIIKSLKVYKQAWLAGSASSATRIHPIMNLEMPGWILFTAIFLHVVLVSL